MSFEREKKTIDKLFDKWVFNYRGGKRNIQNLKEDFRKHHKELQIIHKALTGSFYKIKEPVKESDDEILTHIIYISDRWIEEYRIQYLLRL